MKDLKFIKDNSELPRGGITSTARRGTKWNEDVAAGDVVNLIVTESGANFGRAAIVGTKVKTLAEVCADVTKDNNHALAKLAKTATGASVSDALMADLKACYGEGIDPDELFTVVSLVVLNPEHVGV